MTTKTRGTGLAFFVLLRQRHAHPLRCFAAHPRCLLIDTDRADDTDGDHAFDGADDDDDDDEG